MKIQVTLQREVSGNPMARIVPFVVVETWFPTSLYDKGREDSLTVYDLYVFGTLKTPTRPSLTGKARRSPRVRDLVVHDRTRIRIQYTFTFRSEPVPEVRDVWTQARHGPRGQGEGPGHQEDVSISTPPVSVQFRVRISNTTFETLPGPPLGPVFVEETGSGLRPQETRKNRGPDLGELVFPLPSVEFRHNFRVREGGTRSHPGVGPYVSSPAGWSSFFLSGSVS